MITGPLLDLAFFGQHKDRDFHIRLPVGDEFRREFETLGMHNKDRERVITWRIPKNHPAKQHRGNLLRVPFLAFADETIEDTDAVLGPLWRGLMDNAADQYGIAR